MGSSSQALPNFTSYSYGEPSGLFYDGYELSGCGSSPTSHWTQTPQSGGTERRPHGIPSTLPPPGFARPTGLSTSAPPHLESLLPPAIRMKRELPPANVDDDYINHDSDARHRLSPLSFYRDHRLPLFSFSDEDFPSIGLSDDEKFRQHHQPQFRGMEECGAHQTRASTSMLSDDDDSSSSPERRPYSTFLEDVLGRWSTSPESVDTDLDDDCSVLSLSMSSSLSSSSLSPPFPDSSELRRIDEEDEDDDDDDEALAISTLDLSPTPLSTTTGEDNQDFQQDYEHRYHPIEQYPSQLYNIPTQNDLAQRPQDPSSPPSHSSDSPFAHRDSPDSDLLRPPPPPDLQPSHQGQLDASPHAEAEARAESEPHHWRCSSPSPPPSLMCPSLPSSPSPPLPPISLSSFSLPQAPSSAPQEPGFTEESGLDDLGLGFLSPSLSSVELPSLFSSSSPFYDFGGGPVPESPSRRRSTNLPLLEEDSSDATSSPFSSLFSSPTSEYSDLHHFGQPDHQRRVHFFSLPGSDTDDDLIPPELASKNYVPDPTITVPTSSSYFSRSPSQKRARSLLMWDADGSIEYPAEGGFGFRGSNYHYPPRSPSPDLLDLDPKKIEELGGGEEGKKIWEARQRAARAETLGDMGFDSPYTMPGEREGVDRRSLGRERRKELSALLRLKLGLIGDKESTQEDAARSSKDVASPGASSPLTSAEPSPTGKPNLDADPKLSPPSSTSRPTPPARHASPASSSKSRITSMAQLVANMVFHRQQHPHGSVGHVHDPSRPKTRTSPPTRSRTWAGSDSPVPGPVLTPIAEDAPAPSSSPLAKSLVLSTSKTPKSPLRQMTLPEELTDDDSHDEDAAAPTEEVHLNKEPSSSTLSPLFLCASPLSFSAGELKAS